MATKIRNVELLTLARSDAGTPVLGHVGVGIDANLIQDFEMGLSRVSSAAQFNLALNTEGATTNTAHFGGIAFTQGASADTVMASIKAVNTSVDGYIDLSFNTRGVSDALLIKADGSVSTNGRLDVNHDTVKLYNSANTNNTYFFAENTGAGNAGIKLKNSQGEFTIIANDRLRFISDDSPSVEVMSLHPDGSVGVGTGATTLTRKLEIHDTQSAAIKLVSENTSDFTLIANSVGCSIYEESADYRLTVAAGGNVGIGTGSNAPLDKLNVWNDQISVSQNIVSSSTYDWLALRSNRTIDDYGGLNAEYAKLYFKSITGSHYSGSLHFSIKQAIHSSAAMTDVMSLWYDGKVGIGTGTNTLSHPLEVWHGTPAINLKDTSSSGQFRFQLDGVKATIKNHSTNGDLELLTTGTGNLVLSPAGKVGIGTGSSAPAGLLEVKSATTNSDIVINAFTDKDARLYFQENSSSIFKIYTDGSETNNPLKIYDYASATDVLTINNGKVGIGTGSTTLTELLEVNGNAKATKFIGPLEGNADSATTATTLETTRNIVVGKSSAGAGDIDAIIQSFNGGANISFDSTLNSHLPADLRNTASTNIADEPSNTALKIIGSASKAVQLKINRQGLIVGYDEATITGGGGGGSSFDVTLNDEIYFDASYTDQTTKTIDSSTTAFNLHFNSEALFTSLTETGGTMSIVIGGTTKTLDLPDASFTQLDLDGSTLRVEVGGTPKTVGLSTISVASATNATNADNIAISSENTDGTRYLSFVNGTSGDKALKVDAGLIYNPSSNTLTTTTFSGALSGNATTSSGLLVGSITYTPSSSATGGVSLVSRNSDNEVSIAKLILSDNTTSSNLDVIVGKISGSDVLREFSVGQVRSFIDPDNTRFLPSPTGGVYPLTVSNATSAGSATTAGSAGSISAGVGGQAFSAVTADGFVKLSGGNGTLSVGGLASGDIPNNAANTSGKADTAGTADVADTVTFGSLDISASHANTASTLVVRGADKSINIGALASTDITAQSLELTNASAALKVQEVIPRGSGSMLNFGTGGSGWPGLGDPTGTGVGTNYYVKASTQIGNPNSNTEGAFRFGYFGEVYSFDGITSASDSRVKENIEPLSLGLDFVRLLEPKKYTWKKSDTPRIKFGALAQEIEQVINQLTEEETSLINIANYHENTEEQNEQALKGISQSQVMWVLFNAVKQLDAKVQELEKQLDKS